MPRAELAQLECIMRGDPPESFLSALLTSSPCRVGMRWAARYCSVLLRCKRSCWGRCIRMWLPSGMCSPVRTTDSLRDIGLQQGDILTESNKHC